jgi:hypothetical protein
MRKSRQQPRQFSSQELAAWAVLDDFASDVSVTPAELDAIEAFLMPIVHAILAESPIAPKSAEMALNSTKFRPHDSLMPQSSCKMFRR